MKVDLTGRLAIVTAGSRGIGLGIAKGLSELGAKVAICARDAECLDAAVKQIDESGKRVFAMRGDIGSGEFLEEFVNETCIRFGQGVDILINNNGGPPVGFALDHSEEAWESAISRNFMSVVRLSKLVVPNMKKNKWGRIISLTSLSGKEPDQEMVLSSVTRAAVAAFSKTLSKEMGCEGVTVNTIMTGGVLTERALSFIGNEAEALNESIEDAVKRVGKTLPVQHIATPEEFSQMVLFLASDAGSYISGTAICVDGGASSGIF